jgi:hypothetical protein
MGAATIEWWHGKYHPTFKGGTHGKLKAFAVRAIFCQDSAVTHVIVLDIS